MFQHKCILHDPNLDKPVTSIYDGISRDMSGSRFMLVQGESGKFYGKELELAINALAAYGRDTYGYDTFSVPVQVTLFPLRQL